MSDPGEPSDQPRPDPPVDPERGVDRVASRVQMVIEAAERAAEAIRADAERQAADYLAEAERRADELTSRRVEQIAELTDELVRHAEAVRRHSGQMASSLEHAIRSVQDAGDPSAGDAVGTSSNEGSGPGRSAVAPEVLLYATRMAVAGNDRAAVARALRTDLGIGDPEPVVSKVFD